MSKRVMPRRANLGQEVASPIGTPIFYFEKWKAAGSPPDPFGRRMVMSFALPAWQRPLVWDRARQVAFLESAWRGVPLGTYTFNRAEDLSGPLDNLLIDGQQRLYALQLYVEDELPVFGYRWSEITEVDRRTFENSHMFASYKTTSDDEAYLRSYYDLMNFGGVAHTEDQRATA